MTLEEAYQRCQKLAYEHYENFPVARLVPKELRPHVAAVYAFARTADDIADEGHGPGGPEPQQRLADLDAFDAQLLAAVAGKPLFEQWAWIFQPVAHTISQYQIPVQLFQDLLSAFRQDVTTFRYATFADVLDYCRRSANPVGRLVLILHGLRDDTRFAQSDAICTALQLANFWQDTGVDWKKGRIYVPEEDRLKFGVTEAEFGGARATGAFKDCLRFQCDRAHALFEQGRPLPRSLPFPLSLEIAITIEGGEAVLRKIRSQGYDTLARRPSLGAADKILLLCRGLFRR